VAGVSPEDMRAAYEARLVTEPAAARLAAERGAGVEAARAAVDALRDAADVAAAFEANRSFHLAIVRASGNPFLARFAEMLWATRLGGAVYDRQHRLAEFVAIDAGAHEAIAEAVAARDGEGAERLMREHIGDAMGLLLDELLTGEGYDVRLWPESAGAFELIRQQPTDLVLLDLSLNRRGDGVAVLEQLCADEATAGTPVIVFADDSHALAMLRVLPTGWRCEVLEKPFYLEELMARVARIVPPPYPTLIGLEAGDWVRDAALSAG
jgi:CheY-like chemotaxis protein